ncbi:hypothetical protein GGF50DRAFT_66494 [Schizophyllum commune]
MKQPVYRLPPEILCRIFDFLIPRYPDFLPSLSKAFGPEETPVHHDYRATHVCMFWRNSALGCSRLWSSVVLTSTKPTIAYVERARTTPLTVFYEESLHKDWAAVVLHDILENHTSRIECLHIDAFWAYARIFSAVLASPMPSLRSLSLSVGSL